MSISAAPGLYGKLPILGDFVSRRLPVDFIRAWDTWVQTAISASQELLGAQWLDIYLTSPIWRFVLSPGNCGDNALAGVMMPSVDKVGRYFPLTLAATISPSEIPANLFVTSASWFDALEQLALSALADDTKLEQFDRKLQDCILALPMAGQDHAGYGHGQVNGALVFETAMKAIDNLPEAFGQLGSRLLYRSFPAWTLWSTRGSEHMKPRLLVYCGLPPAGDFADFLNCGQSRPVEPDEHFDQVRHSAWGSADSPEIKWRSSATSTAGKVRELNEDACLDRPGNGMWAVADGMGGHLAGDQAAQAVVDALRTIRAADTIEAYCDRVMTCLQNTNHELLQHAGAIDQNQIMGSTVAVMLAVGGHCASIWAGDSRLYRYRRGLLSQLTRDHSMASQIEPQSPPLPSKPVTQAPGNIVTRALGADPDLELDTLFFEARPGDVYMLCSDGLFKEINAHEIAETISGTDCEQGCRALIDLALDRGARDNVTVIVIAAEEPVLGLSPG